VEKAGRGKKEDQMWALVAVVLVVMLLTAVRAYRRTAGVRVVHCPTTRGPAEIALDHFKPLGRIEVHACSLWPERAGCEQACRREIESTADGCAFREMLLDWSAGKPCFFCQRVIPHIGWAAPTPGLLSPQDRVLFWSDIAPTEVLEVMRTHRPVCSNCAVVEAFRQRRADLVIERSHPQTRHEHRPS
jgi:hypothetical protein